MLEQIRSYEISVLIAVFLVSCLGVFFVYRWIEKDKNHKKINRIIKKISCDYLKDMSLDMGDDQYAHFDYIVLCRHGIMAIDIKDFAGHIFASDRINEWTQIIERKSYKFENPFFDLERKIDLLKQIVPGQKIGAIVLFTDHADFPTGQPENVLLVKELFNRYGKSNANDVAADIMASWSQIKNYLLSNRGF